jgi:hypothetical protein
VTSISFQGTPPTLSPQNSITLWIYRGINPLIRVFRIQSLLHIWINQLETKISTMNVLWDNSYANHNIFPGNANNDNYFLEILQRLTDEILTYFYWVLFYWVLHAAWYTFYIFYNSIFLTILKKFCKIMFICILQMEKLRQRSQKFAQVLEDNKCKMWTLAISFQSPCSWTMRGPTMDWVGQSLSYCCWCCYWWYWRGSCSCHGMVCMALVALKQPQLLDHVSLISLYVEHYILFCFF